MDARRARRCGLARLVLATAPSGKAIADVIDGIAPGGQLLLVAAAHEPIPVSAFALIGPRRSIQGWPSGHAKDSEDTLRFSALSGVRPMVETFPLERAADAYAAMMSGRVRFRAVLTTRR